MIYQNVGNLMLMNNCNTTMVFKLTVQRVSTSSDVVLTLTTTQSYSFLIDICLWLIIHNVSNIVYQKVNPSPI